MAVLEKATSLTGKNQVTVPAEIVEAAGLEKGSQFVWTLGSKPGELRIKVLPSREQAIREIEEISKKYKGQGKRVLAELAEERMRDAIEEYGN